MDRQILHMNPTWPTLPCEKDIFVISVVINEILDLSAASHMRITDIGSL